MVFISYNNVSVSPLSCAELLELLDQPSTLPPWLDHSPQRWGSTQRLDPLGQGKHQPCCLFVSTFPAWVWNTYSSIDTEIPVPV